METLFILPLALIYAALYGVTMKVADLLDEHGLKWFKGSALLFGLLWGGFGALLILSDNIIANIIVAMNIAFIIRNRLDYLNHQVASSIIIIAFLFSATFEPMVFIIFYAIFLTFGTSKDYVDDVLKKENGLLVMLNDAMLYYPIPAFIYCLMYGNWIVFYVFTIYTGYYDLTKYFAKKHGYNH